VQEMEFLRLTPGPASRQCSKEEVPTKDVGRARWSIECREPRGDQSRILSKTLPDGRQVMGWTNDHYKTIHPFTAPHFPDAGW
jgi:hypothetical protein